MLLVIPGVLSADQLQEAQRALACAPWQSGKVTAGAQSAAVKHNRQLPEDDPLARQLGQWILQALGHHPLFLAAALPAQILPPLFNCYGPGEGFGLHVDNAIRPFGQGQLLRTDISATLFFSEPGDYDGGELCIETGFGAQAVKLAAGDMVIYPSTSLHRVNPVTRGERRAAFFWLQSLVRDETQRANLFDLDQSIQSLSHTLGNQHPDVLRLTGVYHNLIRRWADPA